MLKVARVIWGRRARVIWGRGRGEEMDKRQMHLDKLSTSELGK